MRSWTCIRVTVVYFIRNTLQQFDSLVFCEITSFALRFPKYFRGILKEQRAKHCGSSLTTVQRHDGVTK